MKIMICIDNEDVERALTIGKEYQCLNDDGQLVDVVDNSGQLNTYVVERFEKNWDNKEDTDKETIGLSTYSPDPEQEFIEFTVPTKWIRQYLAQEFNGTTLEDFLTSYTWDDTEEILARAEAEQVILKGGN